MMLVQGAKKVLPPCHTKFDLFSIVLGKSDETMPYRLDLGNSFGVVYIAVTYWFRNYVRKHKNLIFQNLHKLTKSQRDKF